MLYCVPDPDNDQDDEPEGEIQEVAEQVAGGQDRLGDQREGADGEREAEDQVGQDSIRGLGGRTGTGARGKSAALSFLLVNRLPQDGVANP